MSNEAKMRSNDIKFETRKIITVRMLDRMYRTPMEILEFKFAEYSDGIISGMDIEIPGGKYMIKITKGMYKIGNIIYVLDHDLELEYKYIEDQKYVVGFEVDENGEICVESSLSGGDQVIEKNIKIVLLSGREYKDIKMPDKYIICRFTGKAILPVKCSDLAAGGYVNLYDCQYSLLHHSTFHPQIFRMIEEMVCKKANKHPMDYIIINELSSHGTLSFDFIKEYIKAAELECSHKTRRELLKVFIEAIDKLAFKISAENYAYAVKNEENKSSENFVLLD